MGRGLKSARGWLLLLSLGACSQKYDVVGQINAPVTPPSGGGDDVVHDPTYPDPSHPPVIDYPKPPGHNPPPNSQPPTVVVKNLKPVLAVRALECVMCHADIQSNVVTDFGFGSGNFFRGAYGGFDAQYRLGWQGSQPTRIQGKLYIPRAPVSPTDIVDLGLPYQAATSTPDNGHAGLKLGTTDTWPTSLKGILQTPWLSRLFYWVSGSSIVEFPSMLSVVQKADGSIDPEGAVERDGIEIRTPRLNEITALLSSAAYPAVEARAQSEISGLKIVNGDLNLAGPNARIVRNDGKVRCVGDVVVNGTLFLEDLDLDTTAEGCRLYVTESVFLQGPITSNRPDGAHNLQIASSRAILMGLGLKRLGVNSTSYANWTPGLPVRAALSDASLSWNPWLHLGSAYDSVVEPAQDPLARQSYFDAVALDARKVGSLLKDSTELARYPATLPAGYTLVTRSDGDRSSRLSVDYTGLLLNAPHIHSGYLGLFKGVIIANVIDFAISHFHFAYDESFDSVPSILPAIESPLKVSDQ